MPRKRKAATGIERIAIASKSSVKTVQRAPLLDIEESTVFFGDALTALRRMPTESVQCIVTSPPYWGLRDYGIPDQIGLEDTIQQFLNRLVAVFSESRRVLRSDGTLWVNMGDGYTSGNRGYRAPDRKNPARAMALRPETPEGLKPKDLLGLPWRLALSLQSDGWYLRSDVVWHKPNAMPESVKDRPSRSHEYLFMLTKSERYFYDWAAAREPAVGSGSRSRRSVWSVNTRPSPVAHFATFPVALVQPCIRISSRPGDVVLDPFFGSGTVGEACIAEGRRYVGVEINRDYVDFAVARLGISGKRVVSVEEAA